ncbi:C39 family peptidase [Neobacillus sp. D3-1R]|uniref:C39 family peptidase n=1 Tax=Neobacillus sp. D3-1R TaxID=3445778 RepID=UPI003FA02868
MLLIRLLFPLLVIFVLVSCSFKTTSHIAITNHVKKATPILEKAFIKDRVLLDVPVITQFPELPRGCEVTSLTMLLNDAGIAVNKMTLANEIQKVPYEKDGYFGNPSEGFVGSMYTYDEPGLAVSVKPILNLANKFAPNQIEDLTGAPFKVLKEQLSKGKPVWVIVGSTFQYVPQAFWENWKTHSGEIMITRKVHSVLLTGYDEQYVYFNDPFYPYANRKAYINSFITSWIQFGEQAITYKNPYPIKESVPPTMF